MTFWLGDSYDLLTAALVALDVGAGCYVHAIGWGYVRRLS